MSKTHFARKALEAIQAERLDLGEKKSHDYSSVADAIGIAGVQGIGVRLLDKVLRIMSLTQPGFEARVTDEALRDTFIDVGNYADYAVALIDGTWNVEEPKKKRRARVVKKVKKVRGVKKTKKVRKK